MVHERASEWRTTLVVASRSTRASGSAAQSGTEVSLIVRVAIPGSGGPLRATRLPASSSAGRTTPTGTAAPPSPRWRQACRSGRSPVLTTRCRFPPGAPRYAPSARSPTVSWRWRADCPPGAPPAAQARGCPELARSSPAPAPRWRALGPGPGCWAPGHADPARPELGDPAPRWRGLAGQCPARRCRRIIPAYAGVRLRAGGGVAVYVVTGPDAEP